MMDMPLLQTKRQQAEESALLQDVERCPCLRHDDASVHCVRQAGRRVPQGPHRAAIAA